MSQKLYTRKKEDHKHKNKFNTTGSRSGETTNNNKSSIKIGYWLLLVSIFLAAYIYFTYFYFGE